jgi:hypothetical protein
MRIILLSLLFIFTANADTYKIQVFRNSDNFQLYGLYADESEREQRLAEAMVFHVPGETALVNEDITEEISAKKNEKINRKNLLKNENANTKERLQALIEHLGL